MKRMIKTMVIAFFYICMLPFGIPAKLTYKLFGSQLLFTMFGEFLSLIPSFIDNGNKNAVKRMLPYL